MTYTRTEEKQFSTIKAAPNPADAVAAAWSQIVNQASSARYNHTVWESVAISVKMANESLFHADAKATFARIVSGEQDEDDDEYAEHDRRKAAELGMDVETYKRAVEDR